PAVPGSFLIAQMRIISPVAHGEFAIANRSQRSVFDASETPCDPFRPDFATPRGCASEATPLTLALEGGAGVELEPRSAIDAERVSPTAFCAIAKRSEYEACNDQRMPSANADAKTSQ